MNYALLTILSLTVSGSLIALLLFLLRSLLKQHVSRTWQYYVFAIVILRLLAPYSPEHSIMNVLTSGAAPYTAGVQESGGMAAGDSATADTQLMELLNREFPDAVEQEEIAETALGAWPLDLAVLRGWVWLLWLIPAVAIFIRKLVGYHRFIRTTKAGCAPVESECATEVYHEVCAAMSVRRPPVLAYHPSLLAPALLGALRPVIALPDTGVSREQLRYILLHELTHYKRQDIVYKWLVQLALCVHWFNPVVYRVSREINRLCELSCDEAVIRSLDWEGMRAYGDMLLDSIQLGAQPSRHTVVSITLCEDKELVKERLTSMLSYRKRSKTATVFSAVLAAVLLVGASFTGAYAAGSEPDSTPATGNKSTSTVEPMSIVPQPQVPALAGGTGEIVKTLAADGIQSIDIYAELCTLMLEKSQSDTFEIQLSFPEITRTNYENHFDLNVTRQGSAVSISTDYEDGRWDTTFEPITGFDDQQYPFVTVLTVRVPEKQYDALSLTLFSMGSTLEIGGIDAISLKLYNGTGNVLVKTDRAYNSVQFDNHVGNVILQMPELGKQLNITNQVGNFVLSLPSEPVDIDLTARDASGAGYDVVCILPLHWTPNHSGGETTFQRGSAQNSVTVGLGQRSQFELQIPQSAGNASTTAVKSANQADIQSQAGDSFSLDAIDVLDEDGYYHQAILVSVSGSASYQQPFLDKVEELKDAYPGAYPGITQYVERGPTSHLLNRGTSDYFALEAVSSAGPGHTYVIAIDGSEGFQTPFKDFFQDVSNAYGY